MRHVCGKSAGGGFRALLKLASNAGPSGNKEWFCRAILMNCVTGFLPARVVVEDRHFTNHNVASRREGCMIGAVFEAR